MGRSGKGLAQEASFTCQPGTDEEDSVATLPQILEPRQYAA